MSESSSNDDLATFIDSKLATTAAARVVGYSIVASPTSFGEVVDSLQRNNEATIYRNNSSSAEQLHPIQPQYVQSNRASVVSYEVGGETGVSSDSLQNSRESGDDEGSTNNQQESQYQHQSKKVTSSIIPSELMKVDLSLELNDLRLSFDVEKTSFKRFDLQQQQPQHYHYQHNSKSYSSEDISSSSSGGGYGSLLSPLASPEVESNARDSTATITLGMQRTHSLRTMISDSSSSSPQQRYFEKGGSPVQNRFADEFSSPSSTNTTTSNIINYYHTLPSSKSNNNSSINNAATTALNDGSSGERGPKQQSYDRNSFLHLSNDQEFLPFILNASQEALMKEFTQNSGSNSPDVGSINNNNNTNHNNNNTSQYSQLKSNSSYEFHNSFSSSSYSNTATELVLPKYDSVKRANTNASVHSTSSHKGGMDDRISKGGNFMDEGPSSSNERMNDVIGHISEFYRLSVWIDNGETLTITIAKDLTVRQLAKQIEAEYWFTSIIPRMGINIETSHDPSVSEGLRKGFLPFFVEHVYNKAMRPMNFSHRICDEMRFGDVVYVITDSSAFGNRLGRIPATQKYGKAAGSHDDTILSTEYARRIPNSDSINSVSNLMKETLDERFQHLLKNSISLKHFLDFCGTQNTQKKLMYWIDVEIYKSCDESTLAIYAEYLFNNYIRSESPLRVDAAEFIKKAISNSSMEDFRKHSVYHDAQNLISLELRDETYALFEESSAYKNLLDQIRSDPIAYRQHDIIGTLSDHFMSEPHNIQPSIKSSSYSTCTALDIYPNIHTSVPQENKDRMKKKVNKLQAILGESLDQETRKKLYGMKQITDETTTASPATFQDEDASEKRPFQDLKKMLGKFVNNASQDVEVFVTGASKEALIAASSTDQKVTIALSGSTEFDHQSATSPSSGPLEVQSLSGEEKKNIQKRASKLEQLLGQQPPTAALMTKSNIELTKLSNDKIDEEDESEEESQTTDLDSGSRINLTSNRKKLNKLANMLGEKISPETIATERESSKQIAKDQLESSQIRNNKKLEKLLGHSSNDLKDTSALKEAKSAGNLFFNRPLADAKSTSENNLAKAGSKERIKPK